MNTFSGKRTVILISGEGTNLQILIDQAKDQSLPIDIVGVVSNQAEANGLNRATAAGINHFVVDEKQFPATDDFDAELKNVVDELSPDMIILAGFMRILATDFVNQYLGKIINIHPSLLPKYRGLHTHQRVVEAGDSVHGASVHFVIPELDCGPSIIQSTITVNEDDTAETLAKKVHAEEHKILPIATTWLALGKIKLEDTQIYCEGKLLKEPVQLN